VGHDANGRTVRLGSDQKHAPRITDLCNMLEPRTQTLSRERKWSCYTSRKVATEVLIAPLYSGSGRGRAKLRKVRGQLRCPKWYGDMSRLSGNVVEYDLCILFVRAIKMFPLVASVEPVASIGGRHRRYCERLLAKTRVSNGARCMYCLERSRRLPR